MVRTVQPGEPFSALVFKIAADPHVGKLAFVRVYSGKLEAGSYALNSTKGDRERIGRLLQMHANHREEISSVSAGDIAAVIGLKATFTGDTLCDPDGAGGARIDHVPGAGHLGIDRAEDAGRSGQDGRRAGPACRRGSNFPAADQRGDRSNRHRGNGRASPRGDRRSPDAGVPGRRQRGPAAGRLQGDDHRFRSRPKGGTFGSRAAKVSTVMSSSSSSRRSGARATSSKTRSSVARSRREYIPSVDAGIREALLTGGEAGFPIVDLKARLVDGSYHEVDSSEMAFKIAGSLALKEAVRRGRNVILEPIMEVEVTTPDEFMGDVIGDLNARRGHIQGMEMRAGAQVVKAFVPLAAMFGYATDLRSATQGRATYSMQFDHYAPLPTGSGAGDGRQGAARLDSSRRMSSAGRSFGASDGITTPLE